MSLNVKCLLILSFACALTAVFALPAIEPQADIAEDPWFGGSSLSDRLIEKESENALAEELQEDSQVHAKLHKGWGGRSSSSKSVKYGKYKSKYKSYKYFRIGKGKYKSSYYRSRYGYRRHYYIYGYNGYPYGYHRYHYGHMTYRPGHLWCNTWKQNADCAGDEISDKKGFSPAQCIDYCNSLGAGCCRIKAKDGECNAHKSRAMKHGDDLVCNDSDFRPYSKPGANTQPSTQNGADDLPRPTRNESVVMFVLHSKDPSKLNQTYDKIGEFLWTKSQFQAAKTKIQQCSEKAKKPCTKFSECSKTCAHAQLKIFMEMAPHHTEAPASLKKAESEQEEVQTGARYESNSLPTPQNGESVAWVQMGGSNPDELGAATSDAINANIIPGARQAVQIDSGVAGLEPTLFMAVAIMAAAFGF